MNPLPLEISVARHFAIQHAATGKLDLFLNSIEEGKVKQGDTLLIESIDRLSPSAITDALHTDIAVGRRDRYIN